MASSSFVLQGLAGHQHDSQLVELLKVEGMELFLAGVAFVKQSGVAALEGPLGSIGGRATFYAGIRNDITSYQGIRALIECGAKVWAVDTATRRRVYHPKLYLAQAAKSAQAVVGSANLTAGGLGMNIEVSARLDFDLSKREDKRAVFLLRTAFDDLRIKNPQHVFEIPDEPAAARLLEEGRLVDERQQIAKHPAGLPVVDRRSSLKPMRVEAMLARLGKSPRSKALLPAPVKTASEAVAGFHLVWKSKPLTERDLSIPKRAGTHPTGSMGLKRGAWEEDIDHRHYFRERVFAAADWEPESPDSIWERASIIAQVKVCGIWHGQFSFKLSHNRDTASKTYRQKNFMTQLHWGNAKSLVARNDLLGRQLFIYRDDIMPDRPQFLIEID